MTLAQDSCSGPKTPNRKHKDAVQHEARIGSEEVVRRPFPCHERVEMVEAAAIVAVPFELSLLLADLKPLSWKTHRCQKSAAKTKLDPQSSRMFATGRQAIATNLLDAANRVAKEHSRPRKRCYVREGLTSSCARPSPLTLLSAAGAMIEVKAWRRGPQCAQSCQSTVRNLRKPATHHVAGCGWPSRSRVEWSAQAFSLKLQLNPTRQ